ncbi:MAG: hypothetical protein EOO59_12290 [Hymenobacter sp.]|nr:MAG: hypothetical protein EOO59_12290 [Hymenobacter sp.]
MKLALAILLNLLALAALGWWLRREHRQAEPGLRRWLLPALALRVVVGVLPHGLDSAFALRWGNFLTAQFWAQPDAAWSLWQGHEIQGDGPAYVLYEWSNTLFIIKIIGVLNFASLGIYWLTSIYFSVCSVVCCWGLVRMLRQLWPAAPLGAGVTAFFLWPSVVWWASGITKETLVLGSGAALVAVVLNSLYCKLPVPGWRRLGGWLLLLGLAWLHVRLRYFFALPLLGSLLALAGVVWAERRGWLRAGWRGQGLGLLSGVVLAGALVVAVGGEPVSASTTQYSSRASTSAAGCRPRWCWPCCCTAWCWPASLA